MLVVSVGIFATDVQFQIRDQFWFPKQNYKADSFIFLENLKPGSFD